MNPHSLTHARPIHKNGFTLSLTNLSPKRDARKAPSRYRHLNSKSQLCTDVFQLGTQREVDRVWNARGNDYLLVILWLKKEINLPN